MSAPLYTKFDYCLSVGFIHYSFKYIILLMFIITLNMVNLYKIMNMHSQNYSSTHLRKPISIT